MHTNDRDDRSSKNIYFVDILRFKRAVRILILTSSKRRSRTSFGPLFCTWKCPRRVGKCICAFGMYGKVKTSTSQWRIQRRFEEFARTPFETKSFYFHGDFSKNQERIINNQVKLTNRPLFKKSWIRHCKSKCTQVKPTQIDQNHPIYIKKKRSKLPK